MRYIINLDKKELLLAVENGVKSAILETIGNVEGLSDVMRTDMFMEAIQLGTKEAVWAIATNATGAPCHDFYDSISTGVQAAIEKMEMKIT